MTVQRNRRWTSLLLLGFLLITILACGKTADPEVGQASAGMHGVNSDGDEDAGAVVAKALPELDSEAEAEQAPASQQEEQASPSGKVTIESCIPQPGEYTLEITDLSDRTARSGMLRHCEAKGMLTNNSNKELIFDSYRVNNAHGNNYEKWTGPGYSIVNPGDTVEFAEFYRACTGWNCEDGEWYYFTKVFIFYGTDECLYLAWEQEENTPESIVEIEDPCFFENWE